MQKVTTGSVKASLHGIQHQQLGSSHGTKSLCGSMTSIRTIHLQGTENSRKSLAFAAFQNADFTASPSLACTNRMKSGFYPEN